MTSEDLKSGMIVELRNGDRYIVLVNPSCAIGVNVEHERCITLFGNKFINEYNPNLTHITNKRKDVIKVFQVPTVNFTSLMYENSRTIWEREEPKKMTVSEICKELGYEVEIVRDDS